MSAPLPLADLAHHLQSGDRAALGRAITLVESARPADQEHARALLALCSTPTTPALRIGITGIPGVGKSTLIDALGIAVIAAGHRVAVLAVDPSSVRSGGSILGDKTRMERLSQHPDAFIRPTATGGALGGVARRTRESILLCEAAGYDRILIETVGVGQSELEVDRMTDLTVLLMIAGAGDELQGIKRGIMETADVVVLTKVEGEGRSRAETAARDLRNAIHLLPVRPSGVHPQVFLVSAIGGEGMPDLARHLEERYNALLASGRFMQNRAEQGLHAMYHQLLDGLRDLLDHDPVIAELRARLEAQVAEGFLSPTEAAEQVLTRFRTGGAPRP
jgi:LAO/AO transport system kinase